MYPSKFSICATCAKWAGARKAIGQRNNYKLVQAVDKQGYCYEQNLTKGSTAGCRHHVLWGVLRR